MIKAILRTLIYADIFDYPLTAEEIKQYLITSQRVNFQEIKKELKKKNSLIEEKEGYFFLKGREKIIKIRKNRQKWSWQKMEIARRVGEWLKLIPTVKMVAVTGALAMENADQNDDIDFLVVTATNRLWLTRFWVVLLVELVARRRRPSDLPLGNQVKDKICLNMFLDEDHLAIPQKERNLFTAHEVCQCRPLWDKDNLYQRFFKKNLWVKKFLANAVEYQMSKIKNQKEIFLNFIFNFVFYFLNFTFLEKLVKKLQLGYMAKRRTREVISEGVLRFHPHDISGKILREYEKRCRKFNL